MLDPGWTRLEQKPFDQQRLRRWLAGGRVRSFSELQELYETNYHLLSMLVRDLPDLATRSGCSHLVSDRSVSRVDGCIELQLQVVERHRYTTLLALTHPFSEQGAWFDEPGIVIRLYHDARVAEVLIEPATPSPDRDQLERRWRLNQFLLKWLHYCLEHGHQFKGRSG